MTLVADVATFLSDADVIAAQSIFTEGEDWADIQNEPAMVIDQAPGIGELYERTFDGVGVMVQCRGNQEDPVSAEALATAVDNALLAVAGRVVMGSTSVLTITRVGGPPRLLSMDTAHRRIFTATYLLTIARTQF